jgi:hypothetical protein
MAELRAYFFVFARLLLLLDALKCALQHGTLNLPRFRKSTAALTMLSAWQSKHSFLLVQYLTSSLEARFISAPFFGKTAHPNPNKAFPLNERTALDIDVKQQKMTWESGVSRHFGNAVRPPEMIQGPRRLALKAKAIST